MKPTVAPLATREKPSVAFTKPSVMIGKGRDDGKEEKEEEGLQVKPEGSAKAEPPPDQKGGSTGNPLIDLPVGPTPKLTGKYVEMLDKEYGLILNLETNELSLRIGGETVKIPRMSEWIERSGDEKDESGTE